MRPATWNHQQSASIRRPRAGTADVPRLTKWLPHVALLLALLLLTWVGFQQLSTPSVVPATASATEFSAERAMDHLRVIAARPRSVGSPGYLAAQTYLVEQLRALGLDPRVQTTAVVLPAEAGEEGFAGATVHNIVARLPGTDNSGAIVLNAHYDSGGTGPGAMDDGSGVVTILETVRALQAGPGLRNDVIIVFADAEEVGMMGAAAFNEQHPWAKDVRLAINYEGAGGTGPAILYATSNNDSWLVSEYVNAAPYPSASSLLTQIVDEFSGGRLDCDLGEYTSNGSAGLGFVVLGNTPDYHTKLDNPDVIDRGSIQQEGENTLAAVRHFGNLDLSNPSHGGDRVFFDVWPGIVASYSNVWVVPFAGLITMLVGALLFIGVRRDELTVHGLFAGAAVFMFATTLTVAVTTLLWFVIHTLNSGYQVMLIGTYQATFFVVAFSILSIALMTAVYALMGRWVRPDNLMGGVMAGALVPLWIASLFLPGMSYLIAWPLLFGLFPLTWTIFAGPWKSRTWVHAGLLAVAAVPIFVLLPGTLYNMMGFVNRMEGLMGIGLLGVLMIFVAPLVGLLIPHVRFLSGDPDRTQRRRWVIPVLTAVVAVALLGWGIATAGFDENHPRPNQIAYHLNADTGSAEWVSLDRNLDSWTKQFFPNGASRATYDSNLTGSRPAFVAPAPTGSVEAPEVNVLSDRTVNGERTVELQFVSPRGAPHMAADIQASGELVGMAVNGREVDLSGHDWARDGSFPVIYHNAPAEGWTLTLTIRGPGGLDIDVEESADGLPNIPGVTIQPRPADMMSAPGFAADPTIVTKSFHFD